MVSANGDYATGPACYVSSTGQSVPVLGALTAVNNIPLPITTSTGPQVAHTNPDGSVVTSTQFSQYLGGTALPQLTLVAELELKATRALADGEGRAIQRVNISSRVNIASGVE